MYVFYLCIYVICVMCLMYKRLYLCLYACILFMPVCLLCMYIMYVYMYLCMYAILYVYTCSLLFLGVN